MGEIFARLFSPEVIVPMMIFAIPLSAVIGSFYLKVQKLKLEKGNSMGEREMRFLQQTYLENQEMKQRIANLEEIVTSMDRDATAFRGLEDKTYK
ncbi:MAG: hypothetical protein MUE85_15640 [Microscillaceae bacterium]|jgi:hypothetical protein|nr:hypothetical protein [Microscillaceae bacterium]